MIKNLTVEETAELIEKGRQLVGKKNLTPEEMVELMKIYRQLEKDGHSLEEVSEKIGIEPGEHWLS